MIRVGSVVKVNMDTQFAKTCLARTVLDNENIETVIDKLHFDNFFLVNFGENFTNGHNGTGYTNLDLFGNNCIWISEDDLLECEV